MLRVGLTGGLATGKSHVAEILAGLGCHIAHADRLGHMVLAPDGAAYPAVVREFGHGILEESGAIDRRKLAAEVFSNPERLALLNSLVHPAVFRMEEDLMAQATETDPHGIFVVEAAILIETGSYKRYSKLILTVCEEAEQIRRAMKRDHLTEAEVRSRLARQMPLADKLRFADFVIDTSGSRESTLEQTRRVFETLRSLGT
jgi:dephospho-CoA kinase